MRFPTAQTFEDWRMVARDLLIAEIEPSEIMWNGSADTPSLFGDDDLPSRSGKPTVSVPQKFLDIARAVACHRNPARFEILYRTLWRLSHGEKHLLQISTDEDVHAIDQMQKAVRRDVHKMKAFVRFRKVKDVAEQAEQFVAWHRPDHRILTLAAPFFARRFKGMHWSILTPDESATWDQSSLTFGAGVPASAAPSDDELEDLWKTYYKSIFNPARVKIKAMKAEMPVRYWDTMPETELIPDLINQAAVRVETMIENHEGFHETATSYFPPLRESGVVQWEDFAVASKGCQACDLHREATQTVFGVGPLSAEVVLVGEQPGDQEDIAGKPFVGPAGELLSRVLLAAGLVRDDVYITNVVKHFKFTLATTRDDEPNSKPRRLHKKPGSREVYACRPWLEAELSLIRPRVLVCLGATPAQAMLGRDFRITRSRGELQTTEWCERTVATWHPAAILRMRDAARRDAMERELIADLKFASES